MPAVRKLLTPLVTLFLLAAPTPGLAGDEQDPEITDPCGAESPVWHQATEALDICSGWFRGLWRLVPREDDPEKLTWVFDGLETTFRLAGEVDQRPDYTQYWLRWKLGGCSESWLFWGYLDSEEWRATFSHGACPDETEGHSVTIPPEHISIGSDRITIRLMISDELAPITERFVLGTRLELSKAQTSLNFETSRQSLTLSGWDETDWGRAFVIGQDRPPDPQE